MKNSRPNASAAAERTTAMSFVVKGASRPFSIALTRQRLSKIVDQPRKHPVGVPPAIELAVQPRPETRRVPDVLESDLGRSARSEEHTSELQSRPHLVCRLLLEKQTARSHIRH